MFNLIGDSSGALYTAYSDHGNGYVLLVSAPLLTAVPFGQPNANSHPINGRKAPAITVTDQVDLDHLGLCRSCHQRFSAVHLCTSQIMKRPTGFLRNGTS
jgi:hypothetical protein